MADIRFSDLTAAAVSDVTAATSIVPISIPGGAAPISRKLTFATLVTWLATVGMIATVITAGGFSSTAGKVSLGAAPGTSAAVNVDASGYGGVGIAFTAGGAVIGQFAASSFPTFAIQARAGAILQLAANSIAKWRILSEAAGMATFQSEETTARIVGGSTNGFAIRNSANARDNSSISDDGSLAVLFNTGTVTCRALSNSSGELDLGAWFGCSSAHASWLANTNATAGLKAGIGYYNGGFASAVEVANVAAGFGILKLMKSGGSVISGGSLTSSNATAGNGYSTGAGGTVVQATSKATGVTLNNVCGAITMQAAALAAAAKISFVVTNSACAATDVPAVTVTSGGTANAYRANVTAVAAGSFTITVENITAGSLSESPVIAFAINKAVTA
jgi:hypothetical protein